MRKLSKVMFLTLLSLILIPGSAYAITGQCSNCHTMHNSQNGEPMADRADPYAYLLRASCVGCHSGSTGEKNSYGAPIVYHTTAPSGQGGTYTLAGGDFYWVATGGGHTDSKGHNVSGIAAEDQMIGASAPGFTPPGWDTDATPGANSDGQINVGGATWATQLTCAGTNGCHGIHSAPADAGITGAHHSNVGGTANQANSSTTVGSSYRFLSGIYGLENADWNWSETNAIHNEYFGVDSPGSRDAGTTYANKHTISYSCAECHGFFHSKIASNSTGGTPWLRHPTDIALPDKTEYANYKTYSVEAPVGRSSVPATSSDTVTPGADTVTCISCHRAHGSPQADLLRWDYSTMVAGSSGTTGCFVCHTTK
jgi:predicted CXXCH cytochrome family protein